MDILPKTICCLSEIKFNWQSGKFSLADPLPSHEWHSPPSPSTADKERLRRWSQELEAKGRAQEHRASTDLYDLVILGKSKRAGLCSGLDQRNSDMVIAWPFSLTRTWCDVSGRHMPLGSLWFNLKHPY